MFPIVSTIRNVSIFYPEQTGIFRLLGTDFICKLHCEIIDPRNNPLETAGDIVHSFQCPSCRAPGLWFYELIKDAFLKMKKFRATVNIALWRDY